MTGRKKLKEIRAELETALGAGPTGASPVRDALRRFLAGNGDDAAAIQTVQPTAGSGKQPKKVPRSRTGGR